MRGGKKMDNIMNYVVNFVNWQIEVLGDMKEFDQYLIDYTF